MLAVKINGLIWMKMGAMAAYTGDIKFKREGIAEGGITKMIKRHVANEGIFLDKVSYPFVGCAFVSHSKKPFFTPRSARIFAVLGNNRLLSPTPINKYMYRLLPDKLSII